MEEVKITLKVQNEENIGSDLSLTPRLGNLQLCDLYNWLKC